MRFAYFYITVVIFALVVFINCNKRMPKRDHIPLLKKKLLQLQDAVKEKNRTAIDSLLSPRILGRNQSSDSLLKLVYGTDNAYAFEQFGSYDIVYTIEKARIDCFIMDTTKAKNRAITFYFIFEHDMWLVTSFKSEKEITDSIK